MGARLSHQHRGGQLPFCGAVGHYRDSVFHTDCSASEESTKDGTVHRTGHCGAIREDSVIHKTGHNLEAGRPLPH